MLLNESIVRKIIKKELLKEQLLKEEYDVKADSNWKNDASYWIKNAGKIQAGGINFNKMLKGNNNWRSATTPDYPEFWEAIKDKFGIQNVIILQAGRVSKFSNPKYGRGTSLSGKSAIKAAKAAGINTLYVPSSDSDRPPYAFYVGNSKGNPSLSEENFKKIQAMLDQGNAIIHCQHGADRTGAIVGRYYVEKGMDAVDALNDAYKFKSKGKVKFHKSVAKYILNAGIKKSLRENEPDKAQKYLDELKAFHRYFKRDAQVKATEKQIAKAKELAAQGLKGKAKALLGSFEKKYDELKAGYEETKAKVMNSVTRKAFDLTIQNIEDSNNFRNWIHRNIKKEDIAKVLSQAGISGSFSKKIKNKKYAKNEYVHAVFTEYGDDYITSSFYDKIKKSKKTTKKASAKEDLNKVDMSVVSIGKAAYSARPNLNIPEKHLKGIIGKKGETRLAIAVGVDTGKIYSRIAGSKKRFVEKQLKENLIFENIKSANDISMRDILKSLSIKPKNIEIIKNNLSDSAKLNFEKKIKNINTEISPELIKQYKEDYLKGNFPKEGKFKKLKDLQPSDFLKVMLKSSEGFVPQVYDDHKKRSTKYGKYGELKRYEDVYGGLGKKGSGNPTIGYGHLIYGGIPFRDERKKWEDYLVGGGKKLSKSEADALFEEDLINHSPKGEMYKKNSKGKILPDDFKLTQNMFDAIIHWTFNAGVINLRRSGIIDALLDNDYKKAARLIKTKYTGGAGNALTRRREKEAKLFLSGYNQNAS